MGLLRKRREGGGTTYRMREKMLSVGDDYWIETEDGTRAFKVNGKALRVRDTLVFESPEGEELFKIQERLSPGGWTTGLFSPRPLPRANAGYGIADPACPLPRRNGRPPSLSARSSSTRTRNKTSPPPLRAVSTPRAIGDFLRTRASAGGSNRRWKGTRRPSLMVELGSHDDY